MKEGVNPRFFGSIHIGAPLTQPSMCQSLMKWTTPKLMTLGFLFFYHFKLKKYEELTYAHGLCLLLTWFAFHFFEQKNRVKLTGCVAQEWEDSSLRDTKVWAPYYGGLRVPLCRQHVSVSYWATGVGRSKGSDLPILSIKFVFATRHTQKLCKNTTLFFERDFIERK